MRKKNYELEHEFNEWKDKEDQQLRELNYPEDKIATLRKYDHDLFVNKTRRQQRKEQITADAFFIAIPAYDKKEINTFMDLLDIVCRTTCSRSASSSCERPAARRSS